MSVPVTLFVLAAATMVPATIAAPSPAPAQTPLKEIGRSRSTYYCTILSKRIAPTLQGLMMTDEAIGAGHRALAKMSDDSGAGNPARLDLDRNYLSQVVLVAAHNLDVVKKLLDDPAYFKARPVGEEDESAASLKGHLQDVAAQQTTALNLLNGALESDLMGQMQSERSTAMQNASGREGATPAAAVDPSQFMSVAGLPNYSVNDQSWQKDLQPGTLRKHTIYDSLNTELEVRQRRVAGAEHSATEAVLAAVPLCTAPRSPGTSPAIGPVSPSPQRTPIPIVIPTN